MRQGITQQGVFRTVHRVESAGDTITLTGLNGNLHGLYELTWFFEFDSVTWSVELKPNNSTTDMLSGAAANNSSPSQSVSSWLITVSGGGSATPGWSTGRVIISATESIEGNDVRKAYTGRSANMTNSTSAQSYGQREVGGVIRSAQGNMTSLVIESTVDFQPGSFVVLEQFLPSGILLGA